MLPLDSNSCPTTYPRKKKRVENIKMKRYKILTDMIQIGTLNTSLNMKNAVLFNKFIIVYPIVYVKIAICVYNPVECNESLIIK